MFVSRSSCLHNMVIKIRIFIAMIVSMVTTEIVVIIVRLVIIMRICEK